MAIHKFRFNSTCETAVLDASFPPPGSGASRRPVIVPSG
jgi:hypothetical protein